MNYTLKNERIEAYNQSDKYVFPKYTSQRACETFSVK